MNEQDGIYVLTSIMNSILRANNKARLSAECLALAQQDHDAEIEALRQSISDRDDAIKSLNDELSGEQAIIIAKQRELNAMRDRLDRIDYLVSDVRLNEFVLRDAIRSELAK